MNELPYEGYTPLPWTSLMHGRDMRISDTSGNAVCTIAYRSDMIEQRANLELISQAPRLLAENKRLREACRLALLDLQKTYANFDFDLWYQSWGNGERHPGEMAIQELRAALAGGGES